MQVIRHDDKSVDSQPEFIPAVVERLAHNIKIRRRCEKRRVAAYHVRRETAAAVPYFSFRHEPKPSWFWRIATIKESSHRSATRRAATGVARTAQIPRNSDLLEHDENRGPSTHGPVATDDPLSDCPIVCPEWPYGNRQACSGCVTAHP